MIKINDSIVYKSVTRPYPVLVMSLFNHAFFQAKIWKTVLPVRFSLKNFLIINADVYYPNSYLHDLPKRVTDKMFADEKVFLDIKKKTLLAEKRFIEAKKKDYKEFFKALLYYVPTLGIYHTCDDFIEDKLRKSLLKKTSLKEVNELMNKINIPLQDNFNIKMKLELLKDGAKGIDRIIKKYSWIISRYGRYKFYSRKEISNMLNSLKKEAYLQKYKTEKEKIKKAVKRSKQLLGDKKHYVDIMQFFVYYRTHRTDIFNKHIFDYHDQLIQLASDLKISYKQLLACTYSEVMLNKIPVKKILDERSQGFVLFREGNKERVLIGKEKEIFLKNHLNKSEETDVIKGSIVYKGRIKGKVVIIKKADDLNKVKAGNILVTTMTTPNMVQAMKKAVAFITDEGGITCHAAILAREMKKPCVIGTKVATQVLKNGDLVEVDADEGIVRIIK